MRGALLALTLGLIGGIVATLLLTDLGDSAAEMVMPAATPTIEPPAGSGPTETAGQEEADPITAERLPGCEPVALRERAGLSLIVGLPDVTTPDHPSVETVVDAGVAGIFLTGYNLVDRAQFGRLVHALRDELGPSLLVATDEETGRVSSFRALLGFTSAPRTIAGQIEPDEWRDRSAQLANELDELGINLNFAPVADLDDGDPQGVIGDRSFSADPAVATAFTLAFAEGHAEGGVAPTVKHFPGHGGPEEDPHREAIVDDTPLAELEAADLVPFVAAIDAGVPAVMMSHVIHEPLDDDLPASVSPAAYELLRELDFAGVAITDSVGMGAVHRRWKFDESAPLSLAAGADAVLATDGGQALVMRDAIVEAVEDGELGEDRLDEAVTRVLAMAGRDPEPVTCRPIPDDFPSALLPWDLASRPDSIR